VEALAACTNLVSLDLAGLKNLGDTGVMALTGCPLLTDLDLSFSNVSPAAVKVVTEKCPLRFLNLKMCTQVSETDGRWCSSLLPF
jgi:hypothetical protein